MLKLQISIFAALAAIAFGGKIPLGPGPVVGIGISNDDAREMLNIALTNVAAKDGPYYTIGDIVSAYKRTFYKDLYEIKATLLDINSASKTCVVKIWKNHWQSGNMSVVAVVFECPGEKQLVRTYIK